MIAQLLDVLLRVEPDLVAAEVTDALWLAGKLPPPNSEFRVTESREKEKESASLPPAQSGSSTPASASRLT